MPYLTVGLQHYRRLIAGPRRTGGGCPYAQRRLVNSRFAQAFAGRRGHNKESECSPTIGDRESACRRPNESELRLPKSVTRNLLRHQEAARREPWRKLRSETVPALLSVAFRAQSVDAPRSIGPKSCVLIMRAERPSFARDHQPKLRGRKSRPNDSS